MKKKTIEKLKNIGIFLLAIFGALFILFIAIITTYPVGYCADKECNNVYVVLPFISWQGILIIVGVAIILLGYDGMWNKNDK